MGNDLEIFSRKLKEIKALGRLWQAELGVGLYRQM
jgi:hypothetical protein